MGANRGGWPRRRGRGAKEMGHGRNTEETRKGEEGLVARRFSGGGANRVVPVTRKAHMGGPPMPLPMRSPGTTRGRRERGID